MIKGKKEYCNPEEIIKDNREDVIGLFHTHPHDEDIFSHSKDQKEELELFLKIMKIPEEEKESIRKQVRENMVKFIAHMSPDDLIFSLSHDLNIECIGTTDKEGKPIAFCFELYNDAKERLIEKAKNLDQKELGIFLQVYKSWTFNEKTENDIDGFLKGYVLWRTYDWVIKEKSEIIFD